MPKTAEQATRNWSERAASAGLAYQEGVSTVRVNPMEQAAAQQDKWAAACADAARNNRFADGCRRVTLDQWLDAVNTKGVPAYNAAVVNRVVIDRVRSFFDEFLPHVAAGVRQLPPRGTIEQNIARARAMIIHNSKFRRRGERGARRMPGAGP